jgi:hypothetical protein
VVLETSDKRLLNQKNLAVGFAASGLTTNLSDRLTNVSDKITNVDDLLEALIGWTHELVGTAEIVNASERFYLDYGKVFHDDSFYDMRTTYFFDHFIFERKLSASSARAESLSGLTPCQLFMARAHTEVPALPKEVNDTLEALGNFRHSIFQIQRLSEKNMAIVDLLDSAKLIVQAKPRENFRGLEKKTIFQGFIFNLGTYHCLSSGLVLHPIKANRIIKKHIKLSLKSGTNRKNILPQLANIQLRHLRHRHVHPKLIYQNTEG